MPRITLRSLPRYRRIAARPSLTVITKDAAEARQFYNLGPRSKDKARCCANEQALVTTSLSDAAACVGVYHDCLMSNGDETTRPLPDRSHPADQNARGGSLRVAFTSKDGETL